MRSPATQAARTATATSGGGPTASPSGTDSGLDVFAYFNNDGGGNAVRNALALRELVTVDSRAA